MTREHSEKHALVVVKGLPQVWPVQSDGFVEFLRTMSGKLVKIFWTKQEAEEALAELVHQES
jgi:hypothetical protein